MWRQSVRRVVMPLVCRPRQWQSRALSSQQSKFDADSAVAKIGEGLYRSVHALPSCWSVGDAPNGGFLMHMALQAATHVCQPNHHPDPLSFTAYYISKAQENEHVDISIRLISRSKSTSTVHLSMSQSGQVRSEYLGTFGDLSTMKGVNYSTKTAPQMASPHDCFDAAQFLRHNIGDNLRLAKQFEFRLPHDEPITKGVFRGKSLDHAAFNAWVSLSDPQRIPTLASMAFFLDALLPPVTNVAMTSWVPTLEYTVHFWAKPTAHDTLTEDNRRWLRAVYTTSHANNGLLYTDGEMWSADGKHLLATSRQMARWMAPKNVSK